MEVRGKEKSDEKETEVHGKKPENVRRVHFFQSEAEWEISLVALAAALGHCSRYARVKAPRLIPILPEDARRASRTEYAHLLR
jgi:hypothetical protein